MKISFIKRTIPLPNQNLKLNRIIIAAGIVSLAAYLSLKIISPKDHLHYSNTMVKAARIMEKAVGMLGKYCESYGINIDNSLDPNRTGLIGHELSGFTTTLGNLQAKRTTTNPNFAAVIVRLLEQVGVAYGDTIAVGCSASFPALMIATLAAAKAMEIHPIIVISLGASSYGATRPDFNLLNIYEVLLKQQIFTIGPAAISLGGDRDIGRDFTPQIKQKLIQQIQQSGIPFIYESHLQKNVTKRLKIYGCDSANKRIAAFVNIGGSYANIGTSNL
ncbi:MAG: poly-gamma-glutamate system protein, partial [bacterium]